MHLPLILLVIRRFPTLTNILNSDRFSDGNAWYDNPNQWAISKSSYLESWSFSPQIRNRNIKKRTLHTVCHWTQEFPSRPPSWTVYVTQFNLAYVKPGICYPPSTSQVPDLTIPWPLPTPHKDKEYNDSYNCFAITSCSDEISPTFNISAIISASRCAASKPKWADADLLWLGNLSEHSTRCSERLRLTDNKIAISQIPPTTWQTARNTIPLIKVESKNCEQEGRASWNICNWTKCIPLLSSITARLWSICANPTFAHMAPLARSLLARRSQIDGFLNVRRKN